MRRAVFASDAIGTVPTMPISFPQPRHMPCPECGAAIERSQEDAHECDRERLLDYQLFQLRDEIDAATDELAAYLDSPRGRFEQWYAERERRGRSGPPT
jgi:hypothetical protein